MEIKTKSDILKRSLTTSLGAQQVLFCERDNVTKRVEFVQECGSVVTKVEVVPRTQSEEMGRKVL
jgi:hypothetical protein